MQNISIFLTKEAAAAEVLQHVSRAVQNEQDGLDAAAVKALLHVRSDY